MSDEYIGQSGRGDESDSAIDRVLPIIKRWAAGMAVIAAIVAFITGIWFAIEYFENVVRIVLAVSLVSIIAYWIGSEVVAYGCDSR